jgi:hypothetical protein
MGLDISAYQKIAKVSVLENAEGEYINQETGSIEEKVITIRQNVDFMKQLAPLIDQATYTYQYSGTFYSSSCHGYGLWRNELARIAGYASDSGQYAQTAWNSKNGRFHDLIDFSDCSGIIGQDAIQRVLIDFENQQLDNSLVPEFITKYHQIWDAFIFAKDDGLIHFH